MKTDELVEQMLQAPAALAYLWHARELGLTPAESAQPMAALFLAREALDTVRPWRGDHVDVLREMQAAASDLRPDAAALAGQESLTRAWFRAMDPAAQTWIAPESGGDAPPRPDRFEDPCAFVDQGWPGYAQKPHGGLFTCTLVDGVHPVLLDGGRGAGDYSPGELARVWRLPVPPQVRVLEIRDARDWHALCASHPLPARDAPGPERPESGITTVNWHGVAKDWDGVHLTLGGLLLAEQRTVEDSGVRTCHRGWDVEQTVWLRWVFGDPSPVTLQLPDGPAWEAGGLS